MDDLDRSILATRAYYDAIGFSLTPVELYVRLIPLSKSIHPSLGDMIARLPTATMTIDSRICQQKECTQKWRHMLRCAWWLQVVPYVRALFASGSLALGNVEPSSDWDVFGVMQDGRLYTARAGLLCTTWCMRRLRTKHMQVAPDRFCFNHLITTRGLVIRHRSIFTAHTLAWLVPMWDPNGYGARIRQANLWMNEWTLQTGDTHFVRRSVKRSRVLGAVQVCAELVLNTFIGSLLERILRRWMQGRIARDPITRTRGGRVIADDRELEFHPHSFETTVLERYNAALVRLGLGQYRERDSGLTK